MKNPVLLTLIFFGLFSVLLLNCTRQDDGPIGLNRPVSGYGFYLSGVLDSGRNFHPWGRDVKVTIDSAFVLTECAWYSEIIQNLDEYSTDRTLAFRFDILLEDRGESSCAALGLNWDTTLALPWSENWEKLDTVVFYADHSAFLEDSVPVSDPEYAAVDTLVIAPGTITGDTLRYGFDSLWTTDHRSVLKSADGHLMHRIKDTMIYEYTLRERYPKCSSAPPAECSTINDTLFRNYGPQFDTLDVWYVKSCEQEILEYCANDSWSVDSAQAPGYRILMDTVLSYHTVFVDGGQNCQYNNLLQTLHHQSLGPLDSVTIFR